MGFQVDADARGRDGLLQLRVAQHPQLAPRARHAGHALRARARPRAAHPDHGVPGAGDDHPAAAGAHHQRRPLLSRRADRRDARVDVPSDRRPGGGRRADAGRPARHADDVRPAHVRVAASALASAATTSRSSSLASTSPSRASAATGRRRAARSATARAGSRSSARAWSIRACCERVGYDRDASDGFRLGHGHRAHRDDQVRASKTSACSTPTTCASWSSSNESAR